MYNWFSKTTFVLGLLAVGLTSCEKDEVRVKSEFGTPPTLTTPTRSVVLTQSNADAPAITYSWNPYTVSLSDGSKPAAPITYTLQFAKAGTNFATVQELSAGAGSMATLSIKTSELNGVLQALNLPVNQASNLDVRLKTFVAGNMAPLYSPVTTLTATPYSFCGQPAQAWGLIGPAGMGWDSDIVLTYDCATRLYSYRGALKADKFKFRFAKAWDQNLGGPSATGGALTQDGPDMTIPKAGNYLIVLDVREFNKATNPRASFTITEQ